MLPDMDFADRLVRAQREKRSSLVLGIDPQLDRPGAPGVPAGVSLARFCCEIIEACAEFVAAIKPQLAFFEARGLEGMAALVEVIRFARGLGLIVIADAKRGDIGSTSAAYAEAFLGDGDFGCDAVTVNPYLGSDAMAPFVARVRNGRGVFVLVKTSNPSSGEFQDLNATGTPGVGGGGRAGQWLGQRLHRPVRSKFGGRGHRRDLSGAGGPGPDSDACGDCPGAGLWGSGGERKRRRRGGPRGRTRGHRQCQPGLDVRVCVLVGPDAAGGSASGRGGDA